MTKGLKQDYQKELFRTVASYRITIPAGKTAAAQIAFGGDTMKQKSIAQMFYNNCVQYEKVKFNSFCWHFYFKHATQRYEQHQARMELYQLYDSDDHKSIMVFNIILTIQTQSSRDRTMRSTTN